MQRCWSTARSAISATWWSLAFRRRDVQYHALRHAQRSSAPAAGVEFQWGELRAGQPAARSQASHQRAQGEGRA
jgi:hypothetical protein